MSINWNFQLISGYTIWQIKGENLSDSHDEVKSPMEIAVQRFSINGKPFTIAQSHIENFPIKEAYLNVLVKKASSIDPSMHVQKDATGAIIVKCQDKSGLPFENFHLIQAIYANPTIKLVELFQVESFLKLVEAVNSRQPPPTSIRDHPPERRLVYAAVSPRDIADIMQHPTFTQMTERGYKAFFREVRFYGIESLFTANDHVELDLYNLTKTVERDLENMFCGDILKLYGNFHKCPTMNAGEECVDHINCLRKEFIMHSVFDVASQDFKIFMSHIKSMNGVISGSAVLASVLDAPWKSTVKDIDIYIPEENLIKYLSQRFLSLFHGIPVNPVPSFPLLKELSSRSLSYREVLCELVDPNAGLWSERSRLHTLIGPKAERSQKRQECTKSFLLNLRAEMVEFLKIVFKAETATPVSKDDLEGSYNSHNGILYVIRMSIKGALVDLVVTKCTTPYVLSMFDFNFNKIYYDGYSVNCLDWKSVLTKYTSNFKDIFIKEEKFSSTDHVRGIHQYVYNIERIKKYFKRGFFVTIRTKGHYY